MLSPPPKKGGALKWIAAILVLGAVGVGGFLGWQKFAGGEPPALAELAATPGPPIGSVGERSTALVSDGKAQLTGRFVGKALKELKSNARLMNRTVITSMPH